MIAVFYFILLGCTQDVSIMKVPGDDDTSQVIVDTSGHDTSSSPILIEGVGGFFHYRLQQVSCPACFGLSKELTVSAEAEFHDPVTTSHLEWLLSPGECTTSFAFTHNSTNKKDVGEIVNIDGPLHSFYISKQPHLVYYSDTLYEAHYDRDVPHSIQFEDGSYIPNAFVSLHGFDYVEPQEMLYIDPSYAFQAPVSRSGTIFYWGPSGSDSYFYITVDVYTPDGSTYLGSVTCADIDTGSMTIPSSYLSQYSPGSLVAIYMNRHKTGETPVQFLESYMEYHMEWEVVGTGYIQ